MRRIEGRPPCYPSVCYVSQAETGVFVDTEKEAQFVEGRIYLHERVVAEAAQTLGWQPPETENEAVLRERLVLVEAENATLRDKLGAVYEAATTVPEPSEFVLPKNGNGLEEPDEGDEVLPEEAAPAELTGDQIRTARHARELSQAALADLVKLPGVGQSQISEIERGERQLNPDEQDRFREVLSAAEVATVNS